MSNARLHLDRLVSRQRALLDDAEPERINRFLDFYARITPRILDAERCSVFIHSPQDRKVWLKAGTGVSERDIEVPIEDSIVGEVIASGRPVIRRDLESRNGAHKKIDSTTGFKTREIVCVPVRDNRRGESIGAVQVLNKRHGQFSEEDQALLEEVAEHIQEHVDRLFLSQEVYGATEKFIAIAKRSIMAGIVTFWVLVSIVVVLFTAYAVIPMFDT